MTVPPPVRSAGPPDGGPPTPARRSERPPRRFPLATSPAPSSPTSGAALAAASLLRPDGPPVAPPARRYAPQIAAPPRHAASADQATLLVGAGPDGAELRLRLLAGPLAGLEVRLIAQGGRRVAAALRGLRGEAAARLRARLPLLARGLRERDLDCDLEVS